MTPSGAEAVSVSSVPGSTVSWQVASHCVPLETEIEPEDPMISIDSVTSAPDRWRSRPGSPARRLTTTPVSEFALICDQMSAGCT